jgi:predicted Zn-dependent peptidase
VELPRLYLTWPSAALFAPGDAELDLAADGLGHGRTSRLYARLLHHRRVATEVVAAQSSRELGGLFQIVATAAPGETLTTLHQAITEELAVLIADGPTDEEVSRGRAQAEAAFVYRTQPLGGFGGRADQLNAYHVYRGQPDWFDQDLARYVSATPASIREALRRWIDPAESAVVSVVPHGRGDLAVTS